MAAPYSDILFWVAIGATVIAQIFILRSTARGIRSAAARGRVALEWMWAILPAVSLIFLFIWTWRTMHPSNPSAPPANITSVTDTRVLRS